MGLVTICVWFCIFVATIVGTGIISFLIAWLNDDNELASFFAWFLTSLGFSICLTYILSMKGII